MIAVDRLTIKIVSNNFRTLFALFTIAIFLLNPILINSKIDSSTGKEFSDDLILPTKIPGLYSTTITKQFLQDSQLPTIQAISTGITWNSDEILDEPYAPVDPVIVTDSNNILHICWANYVNGRTLYHQMIFPNGSYGEKEILDNKVDGESFRLDLVADSFGKIHLAYSWGATIGTQKTYYRYWLENSWSTSERIDHGLNTEGEPVPAQAPKIAVDSTGTPHVIWNSFYQDAYGGLVLAEILYQKRLETNLWSEVIASGFSKPGDYDIVISDNDYIHIIFALINGLFSVEYQQVYYLSKRLDQSDWTSFDMLLNQYKPSSIIVIPIPAIVTTGSAVHCFVNYLDGSNSQILHFIRTAGNWNPPIIISTKAGISGRIELSAATSSVGNIILTWPYYVSGSVSLRYQVYSATSERWSSTYYVTSNYTTTMEPSIIYDNTDNVHLVWRDSLPVSGSALYYKQGFADDDLDGLSNAEEIAIYFTDPYNADTDGDLLNDGSEIDLGMDPLNPDEDTDLILDGWEIQYGFDPNNATDALIDLDNDNLTNLEEFLANTFPNNNDTDFDALLDGEEIQIYYTNPTLSDSDEDLLLDGEEINDFGTDPNDNDTEDDGMPDGYEIQNSLDPLTNDTLDDPDLDGLINIQEYYYNTNPQLNDTDMDKLDDFEEIFNYETNPLESDTDGDFLSDFYELNINSTDITYNTPNLYSTDPLVADTDLDSLTDYQEIHIYLTNPILADTDADQMLDGFEIAYGLNPFFDDAAEDYDEDGLINYQESLYNSNPFANDTDSDSIYDKQEIEYGTNPLSSDTDFDHLGDYSEIFIYSTNASNPDTDHDNLDDYAELFQYFSDPLNNDTDGDTLLDGQEVYLYQSSPTHIDTDRDGLTDLQEVQFNSSPALVDTDLDGLDDYWEWFYGFNPRIDESLDDNDFDGLTNYEEYLFLSNPWKIDTDDDLIPDYFEVYRYFTLPNNNDTDSDMLSDYDEKFVYLTSPLDPDVDDDGLSDGYEILVSFTDPFNIDSDFDGYTDFEEVEAGTNPLDARFNPLTNRIILLTSVSSGIVVFLLIYFLSPYIGKAVSRRKENEWVQIGLEKRHQKHSELLLKTNGISQNQDENT